MLTNLRQIRRERHLTQKELAEKAGIPKVSLVRYELGMTSPNVEIVRKVAVALGVTVDDLIDNKKAV